MSYLSGVSDASCETCCAEVESFPLREQASSRGPPALASFA